VLVDHADARVDCVARRVERLRLAVEEDGPLGRLVEPVQHVHQRGLAGPVLAEQGVDTPALHREINVVVRDDPGESLRDTVHVDRRVHSPVTPRRSLKERGFRTDASETVV